MYNTYKTTDCGANGKTFEKELKAYLGLKAQVSAQNHTDLRKARKNYEVKTSAGELGNLGDKLLPNCSKVIYVPVVDMTLGVDRQEGFILSREVFLATLDACGLIREKTATDGTRKVTIQTFWNGKKNAPTSQKLYTAFITALYDNCEMTLEDWLQQF